MEIDVFQGRNPEKVARDYQAVVKLVRWIPALLLTGLVLILVFG